VTQPSPPSDPQSPSKHEPPALVTAEAAVEKIRRVIGEFAEGPAGQILVVAASTGAGKSVAAREAAAQSTARWDFFVPTHALADQHYEALGDLGVDGETWVRRGPTGLRIGAEYVCLRRKEAVEASCAGVNVVQRLCASCKYRDSHPRYYDEECPAYRDATNESATQCRITIHQMTRLAETLSSMMIRNLDGSDTRERILVLDEPPPMLHTMELTKAAVDAAVATVGMAQPAIRGRFEPLFLEFAARFAEGKITADQTGVDVLSERMGSALREHGDLTLAAVAQHGLIDSAAAFRRGQVAKGLALFSQLREVAWMSERRCAHGINGEKLLITARAPWVRQVRRWQSQGGRVLVLDATARHGDYRVLMVPKADWGNLRSCTVHVHDAPTVARCFMRWASGPRKHHLNADETPRWSEFQGVLRAIASRVAEHGGPLGIITDKPTAKALVEEFKRVREDANAQSPLPEEIVQVIRSGIDTNIGWYGNHRGLDAWSTCRVLVTLGDPYPRVEEARSEAEFLRRNEHAHQHRRCLAEIIQASGRARAVHRSSPILVLHFGKSMPSAWFAPQWATAEVVPPTKGRPKKKLSGGVSDEELRREHVAGASQGELARKYGLAKSTINERLRRLQPTSAAPSQLVVLAPKTSSEADAVLIDDGGDACIDGSDLRRAVRFLSTVGAVGLDTAGSQGFLFTVKADGCRLHTNSSSSVVASSPVLVNEASAHASPFILPTQRWRSIARHFQGPVRFAWGDGSMSYTSGDGAAGTCRSIASKLIAPLEAVPANAAVLGSIPALVLESVFTVGRKHLPRSPTPTLELWQGNRLALCGDTFKVQFECAKADFTRNAVLNPRAAKPLLALCRSARGGLITLHAFADRIYAVNARGDLASWSNGTEAAPSNMWSVRNAAYECLVNTRDWCRAIRFVEANMGYDDRRMVTLGFGRALALRSSGKEHKAYSNVPTIERTYSREIEGMFCIDELLHILRNARAEEVRISVGREKGGKDTGALLLLGTCDEYSLPTGRGTMTHDLRATWFAVGTEVAKPQVRGPLLLTSGT
jgi:hypothetical protein